MSFMNVSTGYSTAVKVEYHPQTQGRAFSVPAFVSIELELKNSRADLVLSIEDARLVADQMSQLLMLHDAAERLAAEKAIPSTPTSDTSKVA